MIIYDYKHDDSVGKWYSVTKWIWFYIFRVKRPGQCRIHPKLSSSSSGSGSSAASTTPPYRQVYNKRTTVSLTSSTEMYAEVYRTSSGESSRSPM